MSLSRTSLVRSIDIIEGQIIFQSVQRQSKNMERQARSGGGRFGDDSLVVKRPSGLVVLGNWRVGVDGKICVVSALLLAFRIEGEKLKNSDRGALLNR